MWRKDSLDDKVSSPNNTTPFPNRHSGASDNASPFHLLISRILNTNSQTRTINAYKRNVTTLLSHAVQSNFGDEVIEQPNETIVFRFFDDECDVLKDAGPIFMPDMATDYPRARSAAWRNVDFDDHVLDFPGEVRTADVEATAPAKEQFFETEGERICPFSTYAETD
jgi:hypothetical protein